MNENEMFALLAQLLREVQQPDILWQVVTLALSLALAWWLARRLRRYDQGHEAAERSALQSFGAAGLRRVAFPLLALLLVLLARSALKHWGHVGLLNLDAGQRRHGGQRAPVAVPQTAGQRLRRVRSANPGKDLWQ